MKKKWKVILAAGCVVGVAAGVFLFRPTKRTEIVWYVTRPMDYDVDMSKVKEYEKLESKQFELFNERLKELEIPAKVTFKYVSNSYEREDGKISEEEMKELESQYFLYPRNYIETLIEKDSDADIAQFSPEQYKQFAPLNDYFGDEAIQKAKASLPEKVWEVNYIDGKLYQIPRGSINIMETCYSFNKSFLKEYKVELDEEKLKKMSPQQVIEWLYPYFEEERVLDKRDYLTSAENLFYENYLLDKKVPLLEYGRDYVVLNLDTLKVEDCMTEWAKLYDGIFKNNLDGHEDSRIMEKMPVFRINNLPFIPELRRDGIMEESSWEQVELGNEFVCTSIGNGVLKNSNHKELAAQVIAASIYDEELSNLMIHGVEGDHYRLEDGYVKYIENEDYTPAGRFSQIGNNLIAYPDETEAKEKLEKAEKRLGEVPILPYWNFVPTWSPELLQIAAEVMDVYKDTNFVLLYKGVPNLEQYVSEQQEKLKAAGIEELIAELQKQVDNWKR